MCCKSQNTKTTSEPWKASQPLLKETIGDATDLYRSGGLNYQFYPGSTVTPLAPETTSAWNRTAARAQQGSPLNRQADDYFSAVARGDYLNREAPGFQSVLNNARNDVNSQKIMSGRYGSEVHDAAIAEKLGEIRYQNYANERGAQERAAGMLPQLAADDYMDYDRLLGVGQQRQGYGQQLINSAMDRYYFNQNAPANAIGLAQDLAGGNFGSTTRAPQPYSPFGQFAGTALQTLPYFFMGA